MHNQANLPWISETALLAEFHHEWINSSIIKTMIKEYKSMRAKRAIVKYVNAMLLKNRIDAYTVIDVKLNPNAGILWRIVRKQQLEDHIRSLSKSSSQG